MSEIVLAAVLPHGWEVIESQAADVALMAKTRAAMTRVANDFIAADLDVIIVLTPHGLRLKGHSAIYTSQFVAGDMNFAGTTDSLRFECDRDLATSILHAAQRRGLSVVGANFGALEGELSCIDMDWGTFVPLWFMRCLQDSVKLVVINPTRDTTLAELNTLGEIIAQSIKTTPPDSHGESQRGLRVGVIASADQGHAHNADGPYGFNSASAQYDSYINTCLEQNRLADIAKVDMSLVEAGVPDSLWQLVILNGIIAETSLRSTLISYEAPTYFGMTVASFTKPDR